MTSRSRRISSGSPNRLSARIADSVRQGRPSVSFEFFPPKDDAGEAVLWESIRRLERLDPTFVSVTYGAGGSSRDRTIRITERIATHTTMTAMAHLTCVGSSRAELVQILGELLDAGVRNIMALRGDPPNGLGSVWEPHPEGLDHADQLVELIASRGSADIGVAAFPYKHPESADLEDDARVLANKAQLGASFAVTQLFFDVNAYTELVERAARHGCNIPIIPGLMPITSVRQIEKFGILGGTPVPQPLQDAVNAVADDKAAVREVGMAATKQLVTDLLASGAPGIHFYTMNRSTATQEIVDDLGLCRDAPGASGSGQSADVVTTAASRS